MDERATVHEAPWRTGGAYFIETQLQVVHERVLLDRFEKNEVSHAEFGAFQIRHRFVLRNTLLKSEPQSHAPIERISMRPHTHVLADTSKNRSTT